jgi:predicted nucleotidyltransferase
MRVMSPGQALQRLQDLVADGSLDAFCDRHGVDLMVVFGSVVRQSGARPPADLDVAVLLDERGDLLTVMNGLIDLLGFQEIDLLDLRHAGPLPRSEALTRCQPLHERHRGLFARSQMAALTERMETRRLRSLDLDLLAG